MGGSPAPPKPITPGQAAQAAVGTASAGEMMSVADQPVEQYGNLYTTSQLGPAETQSQTALSNQAALQSAQAQRAIQSQVDPLAYQQREMRLQSATDRLGQLYGQNPSAFSYTAPGAFAQPSMAQVPNVATLGAGAGDIAANLRLATVNSSGANPQLSNPKGTNLPASYY